MSEAPTSNPEQFARIFEERFTRGDYTAIFMHGCCYHFALAVHEAYNYPLEYLPSESRRLGQNGNIGPPAIGHCWALKQSGLGIEINGVHLTKVLGEIYSPASTAVALPIEPHVLKASLAARAYPDCVNQRAFKLARDILKYHLRFQTALPVGQIFGQDNI